MIRIDREHPLNKPLGTHEIVAENIRRWAKDKNIILADDITNHDIMNVYHHLLRTGHDCDEDTTIAFLISGVVAFGYDGSLVVAVDKNDNQVPWGSIKLPDDIDTL